MTLLTDSRLVRKAVRGWLRLPHDLPKSMFYARVYEGGLGIPELCVHMRLAKRDRLNRLLERAAGGTDPVLDWMVTHSHTVELEKKRYQNVKFEGSAVTNMTQVKDCRSRQLHGTVDGRGLSNHAAVPSIHSWVSDGTRILSGRMFIGAVQVRCNSLFTRGRAARGRPSRNSRCSMCKDFESLAHILQICARTWSPRNERHDTLVKEVATILQRKKFEVELEPRIPTRAGIQKPDIVAWIPGDSAVVIDATVAADHSDLAAVHLLKVKHYDTSEIREWVCAKAQCDESGVFFSAVAFNWRGALAKPSAKDLKGFGFTLSDLRWLTVTVLKKGFETYLFSRKVCVK